MRRLRALLVGAALLVAAVPGSVQAGSLTREADTVVTLFCGDLTSGTVEAFVFAETSDAFGSFTDVVLWTGGGSGSPDVISSSGGFTLTPTGGSGSVGLVEYEPDSPDDPFGAAAGSATLSAAFAPSGPAEPYEFTQRDGNTTIRIEGVIQPLSVSGILTVDFVRGRDASFALSTCSAQSNTFTLSSTDPSTFVSADRQISVQCSWQVDGGFVELSAFSDRFGTFTELHVFDGRTEYHAFAEPTLTESTYSADYELLEGESGDPAGTASASATLTQTDERIDVRDRTGNHKFTASGYVLAVDGSLTIDVGRLDVTLTMDEASCTASDVRIREIIGKATGPKLRNDAPSGAVPLAVGSSIEVKTGGTAFEPEAQCTTDFDGHSEPLPITHTAWWTFTGTGGDVTVDTAGSDFDTIVGVYVLEGGQLVQVGCVDDVFDPDTGEGSLLARLTVATVEGQTYYVQAGGFGGSAGTLRMRIE